MSDTPHLDGLISPEERRTLQPIRQKWELRSRFDEQRTEEKVDKKAWEACRTFVLNREEHRCKSCRTGLVKSLGPKPNRYECHHLRSRNLLTAAERVDPKLCVALCLKCHHELKKCPPKLKQIGQTAATVRFEKVKS